MDRVDGRNAIDGGKFYSVVAWIILPAVSLISGIATTLGGLKCLQSSLGVKDDRSPGNA